jgi:peroxiredoxin
MAGTSAMAGTDVLAGTESGRPTGMQAAEAEWFDRWRRGPGPGPTAIPAIGEAAPDATLPDHTGRMGRLSEHWAAGPALIMFWRHFGCGCGADRAARLRDAELAAYRAAGASVVIVGQAEPERARAYRDEHRLDTPILCDPDFTVYRAYGLGDWPVARVLYDAPEPYWSRTDDLGRELQASRRALGRPMVDNPWMSTGEFVIDRSGRLALDYRYQYCEDFPDPRVLTTAVRLARVDN